MGAVGYWVRGVLRHRRAAGVGLVALVAVAMVVPLTSAAAARRTASSLDRMREELRPHHADVQFEEDEAPPDALERLRAVPGVELAVEAASILALPAGSDRGFLQSFGHGGIGPGIGTDVERSRVVAGRPPDAADEVMVVPRLAAELGLGVGDTMGLQTLSWEGLGAAFEGEAAGYDGPEIPLEVVGIGEQPAGLTGGDGGTAPDFVLPSAFFERWAGEVAYFDGIHVVRLADGVAGGAAFEAAVREAFPERDDVGVQFTEEQFQVDDAVAAQAMGLALLAGVAGVAAVVVIAQALARQLQEGRGDELVLSAMGMGDRARRGARVVSVVPAMLAGTAVAVVASTSASGWFPTGVAGRVEPDPGVAFDPAVALLGLLVALALAATCWRRPRLVPRPAHPSRVVDALAGVLPVPALTGLRAASRPVAGRVGAPARSVMVASVAGAAGVVAAVVFGASLARLVDTPARYGASFDATVSVGDEVSDEDAFEAAQALQSLDVVQAALVARINDVDLEGREQLAHATRPVVGEPSYTLVSGRAPADGEVALGATTLAMLGASIGDTVGGRGVDGDSVPLRVVGQALFPTVENEDPALGVWMTLETYGRLASISEGFPDVFVDLVDGVDAAAADEALGDVGFVTRGVRPAVVGNLRGVSSVPYALAAFLGALALLAVAHAVLTGQRRRRTELAVLKTLGLGRRGLASSVLVHAAAFAVVGLAAGIPLGLVVGRQAWRAVAGDLGFATDALVPAWLALLVPAAIAAALVLSAHPARAAAATRAADLLRAE